MIDWPAVRVTSPRFETTEPMRRSGLGPELVNRRLTAVLVPEVRLLRCGLLQGAKISIPSTPEAAVSTLNPR